MVHFSEIEAVCSEIGLQLVGCTESDAAVEEADRVLHWQESGYAAEMFYMTRDPNLFVSPDRLLPSARSVISVAVTYESRAHPPLPSGFGRVARYAWGRDYHKVLKEKLLALSERLSEFGATRTFTDAVPLLERAYAHRAGLGFIGKNTLLIRPKVGSYFFLGEVITDFEIDGNPEVVPFDGCKSCSRCKVSCPTGAIVEDRVVDARRCISYLTIEKKDNFTDEEALMIGQWLFGCDICQDVCPYNHAPIKIGAKPQLDSFSAKEGTGPVLSIEEILKIPNNEAFKKKFSGTPIMRAKRSGLIRNACAVAANMEYRDAIVLMEKLLDDSDTVVRFAAMQALDRL